MASNWNSILTTLFVLTLSFFVLRELDYHQQVKTVSPPVTVYVSGAVKRPGTVSLPFGARRIHALTAAGGLLDEYDPAELELAKPLVDGETILVPTVPVEVASETEFVHTPGATRPDPTTLPDSTKVSHDSPGQQKLALNTASAEQLQQLPGVGPVLARRIVAARDSRPSGTFATIEDLSTIRGIKRKTTARLAPYLELEAYDR